MTEMTFEEFLMNKGLIGSEEGDVCGRLDGEGNKCEGKLEYYSEVECYCSATEHPPCGAHDPQNQYLVCDECAWEEGDDKVVWKNPDTKTMTLLEAAKQSSDIMMSNSLLEDLPMRPSQRTYHISRTVQELDSLQRRISSLCNPPMVAYDDGADQNLVDECKSIIDNKEKCHGYLLTPEEFNKVKKLLEQL